MAPKKSNVPGKTEDAARNEAELSRLAQLLTSGRFLTAAQITVETQCSKPVAHKRLRTLHDRGHAFQTRQVREGCTGPKSTAYAIVTDEKWLRP